MVRRWIRRSGAMLTTCSVVLGFEANAVQAQEAEAMPAVIHHQPVHAALELRGGVGTGLFVRPERDDFSIRDPDRANGRVVTQQTRLGPALVLHGGGGVLVNDRVAFGLEYRWVLASMNRSFGPLEGLGSLDPRVTLQGLEAYVQGFKGHWVVGARLGLVALHEQTKRGGPLFFSAESEGPGGVTRDRTVGTYTLGGSIGYRGVAGASPKAFGWHALVNLDIVGLEPFEPVRAVLSSVYGRQYLSDWVEGLLFGVELGLDFN